MTIRLTEFMADKGPLWAEMQRRHELQRIAYEDLVAWPFGDYVFGTDWDVIRKCICSGYYHQAAKVKGIGEYTLGAVMSFGFRKRAAILDTNVARVLHRHLPTVAITGVLTVAILVPALVLVPDDGIDGATRAFLVGNVAAAVVAIVFHRLGRRRRVTTVPEPGSVEDGLALHP